MKTYEVVYELDGDSWMVTIPGKPNGVHCVTWGSSIAQARRRVREALAACLDDDQSAADAIFVERFRGKRFLRLDKLRRLRSRIEGDTAELAKSSLFEARRLVADGYSTRDVAALVGISHQRVSQLLKAG